MAGEEEVDEVVAVAEGAEEVIVEADHKEELAQLEDEPIHHQNLKSPSLRRSKLHLSVPPLSLNRRKLDLVPACLPDLWLVICSAAIYSATLQCTGLDFQCTVAM